MRKAPLSRWLPGASRGTLAALLLAAPVAAGAQGFAGAGTVVRGSVNGTVNGVIPAPLSGPQTITIPTSSPVTTINWTPSNAPNGGSINFLPAGNTVNYIGTSGATVPYTVLNRIISPGNLTIPIAFNGAVTSTPNTRVWFYSPGGLLIGATASFNVGGLVLTAADPVTDSNNNFMPTMDQFIVNGVAGSTSAITIQPGATINALNSGQSNYIVAIAPQIIQGGNISVAGSVALVAAESASFAVDSRGLFTISVTAGTTVASAFVHTGSTGGPNSAPNGGIQRAYMVAVPKNNAISMAIASGGSIGFAVADAAQLDGDQIVLSAGSNIMDTGSGNPVVAGRAGSGTASLTVGAGAYTSNTYAISTDVATITDPAASIAFNSDLTLIAPQATVNAAIGTISVAGDLTVKADNSIDGNAKTALVAVAPGASLAVGTNAAALGVSGAMYETADDRLTGMGGSAILQVTSGSLTTNGDALVSAIGEWDSPNQNTGGTQTAGGTAQVSVIGGTATIGRHLNVSAIADGSGSNAALISATGNQGIFATGGTTSVIVSGSSASISAGNGIGIRADAFSGNDSSGYGGTATGGSALVEAIAGGAISVGLYGSVTAGASAFATAATSFVDLGSGGSSYGGTAQIIANAGTITVVGANGISAFANATGGSPAAYSGNGGYARGGTALIATQGANASIMTNTSGSNNSSESSTNVDAIAQGGGANGYASSGGIAVGGTATLEVTGAGQSIAIDRGVEVAISALATGGMGAGTGGGYAVGGSAQLLANGGSIAVTNTFLAMDASATGGSESTGTGGNATAGTVRLGASNGGTANVAVGTSLSAFASGGASYSGNGGNALGGNIFIDLGNNAVNYGGAAVSDNLNASYIAGTSASATPGTAASAGGVRLTDLGALSLAGAMNLSANTPFYVQAGGSIAVSGSITGTGVGAYLHLWADDTGTGFGTVTLAPGALNLPGNQIDIYYNPASLGTPTDFSGGIAAGNATAYQLVNSIDGLQQVGSFLSQNFALGRNIDASATQGWNGGTGFVPIGSYYTPFTGNFDGLNHLVTNLYINSPTADYVGLFGQVGAGTGANIVIRNVGLVSAQVAGFFAVGGLVGEAGIRNPTVADAITITNAYMTGGAVSGIEAVGGLVADIHTTVLTAVHSDAAVSARDQTAGGLVGVASNSIITNAFATGSVNGGQFGDAGGLVGLLVSSTLSQTYASGKVSAGQGASQIGGLVGEMNHAGSINRSYAVGAVNAGPISDSVGGLIGDISAGSSVNESWASSAVSAPGSTNVGGFVGQNFGTITNSYWDTFSTGQANGAGNVPGPVTGLNSVTSDLNASGNNAFYSGSYANFPTSDWVYDNGLTRPVGAWETPVAQFGVATIASAHQVQLIDFNLGGSYTVTQNIDMRGTAGTADIWNSGGFMPLGLQNVDPPFTGTLEGAGHVLSNLTMNIGGGYSNGGLVQTNEGTISDIGLANVNITARFSNATGAIAGVNAGLIKDSFATGTISLSQYAAQYGVAGGLVGVNSNGSSGGTAGSISQAYATVAISGGGVAVGGLVGDNEGAISGSFANGPVSGTLAGGLIGESTATSGPTVTNSYWDNQLTGQSLGCGSVGYSGACSGATGLTTAQTLQSASFTGFVIDTQGGQGLPWRQYEGQTTPLLEAFLTPIHVRPDSVTMQYDAQLPDVGVTEYGAQPSLTFGTAQITGLTRNAVVTYITYGGGLYSTQLGYDFLPSSTPGTLVITQAPLTLAAVSDTRGYNATTTSTGVAQVSGLYGEDNVASLSQSFTSPNVMGTNGSTLAVNAGYVVNDGNGGNNYSITLQSAQGSITPAALAITYTANSATSVYGQTISGLSGAISAKGLQGSDMLASVISGTASFATGATALSNVGSYAVTGSGLASNSGNYSFSFAQAPRNATALTIDPASLTVAANAQSRSYGATNPALTYSETGLVNGDTLAGSLGTSATMASNIGQYGIAQGSLSAGGNYFLTYTGANLTINPASLVITYNANSASSTYGVVHTGLSGSESASGLVNGDTLSSVTGGAASFSTAATAISNVGSYAVTGSGLSGNDSNYSFSFAQGSGNATALTIVARALTLTADPLSRVYGGANPTSDTTTAAPATDTTGLVNGDSVARETVTSAATAGSGVGLYALDGSAVQFSSGIGSNYAIVYASNPTGLSITPAAATITYIANPLSSIYGNAPTGLSGSESASGLVNSDTLASVTSGTAGFAAGASGRSSVGSYAVSGSGLAGNSGNYSFSFAQAPGNATALTIVARALTLTADPLSRVYGGANPTSDTATAAPAGDTTALAASTTGLVNGDSVGNETVTSAATSRSGVGLYALNGSAAQFSSGISSNYAIVYASNPTGLSITPAALTLLYTAAPAGSTYGAAPSGLTGSASFTGLVNGDTAAGVSNGNALWTSPASAASSVGAYAINGSGIGLANGNYSLTTMQAAGNVSALTVTPAGLNIVYTGTAISRVYGASNPFLSGSESASGLVNGDTLGSVTSGTAAFSTPASAASNVGSYAVNGSGLAGSSLNYTYSFTQALGNAAALAVTPASVTITYLASPLSSIYGNVPGGLSGSESASGLVNGETLGGITSGAASFTTAATGQSSVGSYAVTGSGLAGNSGNYSFSFAQWTGNAAALTIVPRPITVTADPQQRQVGAADPPFSYAVTGSFQATTQGLVNGDKLTGRLTSAATTSSASGHYDIVQGTLAASANYQISYVGNILTVVNVATPLAPIGNMIAANLLDQTDSPAQRKQRQEAELEASYLALGLHAPQIVQSLINDRLVTVPPPVKEPVTSNGNSSLWSPGAP